MERNTALENNVADAGFPNSTSFIAGNELNRNSDVIRNREKKVKKSDGKNLLKVFMI
jgi:hypothetical protein